MSEQDQQTLKDAALGKYSRLKQELNATKAMANKTASEMEIVANQIRGNSSNLAVDSIPWLSPEYLKAIIADVDKAELEVGKARDEAIALGVAIS
jgi:hypothetical protein